MQREVMSPQRMPRLIAFKIDGTGTASLTVGSKDGVLTDNGTGDYSIALSKPFARSPIVVATPSTAGAVVEIAAASASAVQILVKDTSGAALDGDVHVLVHGFDAADEY
jgi:hypothetical protein